MKSMKVLAVSAGVLASISVASVSFADDSTSTTKGSMQNTGGATNYGGSAGGTVGGGASQTTGTTTTVTTPSAPATTATQTTQTTLDANGTAPTTAPTSTTTTTSAETLMAPSAPPRESDTVTLYDKRRPNTALLVTGAALLGSTYATTAAIHAANGREGTVDDHLYIPIAGPWINLANADHETRDTVLIAGSGVLQGVGAALFISSFFISEKQASARIAADNKVKVRFAPTGGPAGAGLGAIGTF